MIELLKLIREQAQNMREEGESDMRCIIWLVDDILSKIEEGKSTENIVNYFKDEE